MNFLPGSKSHGILRFVREIWKGFEKTGKVRQYDSGSSTLQKHSYSRKEKGNISRNDNSCTEVVLLSLFGASLKGKNLLR